jgi:hypothetical protein
MRRSAIIWSVLILFLLSVPTLLANPTKPYWLREGAYLTYYAFDDEVRATAIYYHDDRYYFILSSGAIVNFTVLEVKGDTAKIGVKVVLLPSQNNDSPVKITTTISEEDPEKVFSWVNQTNLTVKVGPQGSGEDDSLNLTEAITDKPVVIEGEYLVSLTNGSVYTLDGEYTGHTILWGLYELSKGDTIFVHNGTHLTVLSNDMINKSVITYYRTFQKPNARLMSRSALLTSLPWVEAVSGCLVLYSPQLDIPLTFMGAIPDLKAVGVIDLSPSDREARKFNLEHKNELGKLPVIRMQGLSLYKTNVMENTVVLNSRKPESALKYAFVFSLLLLGVFLFLRGGVLNGKAK